MKIIRYMAGMACLFVSLCLIAQEVDQQAENTEARSLELFEAYLDGVMAAQFRDYALAGMTFSLVKDGRLYFSKGYGYADIEN